MGSGRITTSVVIGVSRLWIHSLLDRTDAIAGAQLP